MRAVSDCYEKNSAKFLNELWAYYPDSFFRNREGFPLLILLEGLD